MAKCQAAYRTRPPNLEPEPRQGQSSSPPTHVMSMAPRSLKPRCKPSALSVFLFLTSLNATHTVPNHAGSAQLTRPFLPTCQTSATQLSTKHQAPIPNLIGHFHLTSLAHTPIYSREKRVNLRHGPKEFRSAVRRMESPFGVSRPSHPGYSDLATGTATARHLT